MTQPGLSKADRAAIQASTDSVRALARRYGVNPKTIQRWRHRATTENRASGPRRASALSPEDETIIVSFRQVTLLALDDCWYALHPFMPHLRRSTLHRCLRRHGLPALLPALRARRGAVHVGETFLFVTEAPTRAGLCHLFAATDRGTRFVFATIRPAATAGIAAGVLAELCAALPYRIDTVITDNAPCFVGPHQAFRQACAARGIRHDLVPLRHATTPRTTPAKYLSPEDLRAQLDEFVTMVNDRQRLKTLGGITPREALIKAWQTDPCRFHEPPKPRPHIPRQP